MKLSQLKKKYPKAFDKFEKHIGMISSFTLNSTNVRSLWADTTDFMDKQMIYIFIERHIYENGDYCFRAVYTCYLRDETNSLIADCKSRKQAEIKAICKAFEILEERL